MVSMKFLSICSGIEAASAAWGPLGWQAVGFSEIDRFASAVLAHRHPTVPNFGDMLGYRSWDVPPFDILVGGPPCQAFSVSGLQQGLADPRGQLSLTYCDLADHFNPAFTLWENVPGVLSNRTNPFGCLLGRLCGADAPLLPESGHVWPGAGILSGPKRTLAWRTLDAQYFGLAQRRKRVFLLASRGSGNWTGAAALFPVSEGVPGNTPPRRGTGTAVAALTACGVGTCGADDNQAQAGHLIRSYRTSGNCGAWDTGDVTDALTTGTDPCSHIIANCLTAREGKGPDSDATTTLISVETPCNCKVSYCSAGDGYTCKRDTVETLRALQKMGQPSSREGQRSCCGEGVTCAGVRRLTVTECERLMGLPDDYTSIPFGRKPAADAPRYKAIGNSMAVNVMRWIGERILFAQSIMPPCSCGLVKLGAPPLCPICD